MPILAVVGAIWLAVLIAIPRKPALIRNEAAWLVYSRQHGAWHRLLLVAVIATLVAVFFGLLILIHDANSDLFRLRNACAMAISADRDTCWQLDSDNNWHTRIIWN